MASVDDAQLVRLAAGRRAKLFPVFGRVATFGPLIVLLAVVPGLYALVVNPVLSESGALWGLKSIDVLTATGVEATIAPSGDQDLPWQNPLGSWLTALVMWAIGPSQRLSLVLIAYLAHTAVVGTSFVLFRRLFDGQFGFWVALMLACHGPFLIQVQNPVPNGLGLWFALIAFWAFLLHVEEAGGVVSWYLLAGGIALGLCLISGGPLALAVTAILLLYVLGLRGERVEMRRAESDVRKRYWVGRSALKSLGALLLTAFAVGGWWVLKMSSEFGSEFRVGWLTGHMFPETGTTAANSNTLQWLSGLAMRLFDEFGLLSGFVVLGAWHVGRELLRTDDESRRRPSEFLVAWCGVALLIWQATPTTSATTAVVAAMWESFFLIPFIAVAAVGVTQIVARRFSLVTAAVVLTATILTHLASAATAASSLPLWSIATIPAAVAAAWGLHRWCGNRDSRSRAVLSALVVVPILLNAWSGLRSARPSGNGTQLVRTFGEGVADVNQIGVCIIVSDEAPPPQLRFAARSLWPDAELISIGPWEQAADVVLEESLATMQSVVLVDWGNGESRLTNLRLDSFDVEQIAQPRRLGSQDLKTYLFKPR